MTRGQSWIDWCLPVLESLNHWLSSAPVSWANSITMVLFLILLAILWSFPRAAIMQDAPDDSWWRDLRIWGTLLIFIQLAIYALFR